ncbi:MAG: ABC transporter substrate-binding protein [Rhodospirillales bacterium]
MRRTVWLLLTLLFAMPALAETNEVRIAQQTSIAFLQFNVMKHQGLIEKHAKALGVPDVKVTFATFNGPDAMNDALLSGAVDIVSGGPPGLLVVWSKTWGSSQEVRGVGALAQLHFLLNTRNPNVKSIRDFTATDRIAMPAVKVAAQSVLLEMAAAKEWGDAAYEKLDPLTIAMSPSDTTAGLLSGGGNFNSAFTIPPFQEMQLKDPAVHTVLDSRDILGTSSASFAWATKKFHDANPKVFLAVVNAMKEASSFIMAHKQETVAYYLEDTRAKVDPALIQSILDDPANVYSTTPLGSMKWADFMYRVGRNKVAAKTWKDMFWPEIWDLPGN